MANTFTKNRSFRTWQWIILATMTFVAGGQTTCIATSFSFGCLGTTMWQSQTSMEQQTTYVHLKYSKMSSTILDVFGTTVTRLLRDKKFKISTSPRRVSLMPMGRSHQGEISLWFWWKKTKGFMWMFQAWQPWTSLYVFFFFFFSHKNIIFLKSVDLFRSSTVWTTAFRWNDPLGWSRQVPLNCTCLVMSHVVSNCNLSTLCCFKQLSGPEIQSHFFPLVSWQIWTPKLWLRFNPLVDRCNFWSKPWNNGFQMISIWEDPFSWYYFSPKVLSGECLKPIGRPFSANFGSQDSLAMTTLPPLRETNEYTSEVDGDHEKHGWKSDWILKRCNRIPMFWMFTTRTLVQMGHRIYDWVVFSFLSGHGLVFWRQRRISSGVDLHGGQPLRRVVRRHRVMAALARPDL